MTRTTNARLADFTFLFYIAAAITHQLMWIPMAAFELRFSLWLLIKGVVAPMRPNALQPLRSA